jgi:hypothetical protein
VGFRRFDNLQRPSNYTRHAASAVIRLREEIVKLKP